MFFLTNKNLKKHVNVKVVVKRIKSLKTSFSEKP